jgi:hypothetical protein
MKQLVYRNILGNNPRKHEVSIEEICNRSKSRISRKFSSKYFVKERYTAENIEDIKQWIRQSKRTDIAQKSHILTTINSRTAEYKIACKVMGIFYVIWGLAVYKLVYLNEIKIRMQNYGRGLK